MTYHGEWAQNLPRWELTFNSFFMSNDIRYQETNKVGMNHRQQPPMYTVKVIRKFYLNECELIYFNPTHCRICFNIAKHMAS